MKLSEFLTEDKWCKRRCAEDHLSHWCDPRDPQAVRWCAVGAATKLGLDYDLHQLAEQHGYSSMGQANDAMTHAQLIAMLKEADL